MNCSMQTLTDTVRGRSALDAVGKARERCWRYDWVLDLDIKGFFDNIDQNLLMRRVKKHAKDQWNILYILYIERWLKAPMQEEDGRLVPREKGTPQGGVASPLLANLFLHYAFDRWLATNYPQVAFERFADDVIVHCRTEGEALAMRKVIAERLQNCGLELHPEKTKIVYCKDDDRRRTYLNEKFDFLGYTFRARSSMTHKGKHFINFSPAISAKAAQAIRTEIRSWKLPQRSDKAIEDLSRMFNPIVRGWLQYYGRYYRSALYSPMRQLDRDLTLWAAQKYKKLRRHLRRATHWIARLARRTPGLFAHWQMGVRRGSVMGAV
jgi:RNA-directed DNA polymerase